jgi:hypothetical protein
MLASMRSKWMFVFIAVAGLALAQQATLPALPTKKPKLPDSAKALASVDKLGFMSGRWIGVNPNGTVNEEHWMTPRGTSLIGTFRQIRRDGKPGLVELSLITEDKDGLKLSLRHLHGALDIPKGREELDQFRLKSVTKNRVEFYGVGKSEKVTAVIYERVDKNRLTQTVQFAPDTKEAGYRLVYFKE